MLRITILVDNHPGPGHLRTGWGFSALVESDDAEILFDSGPKPDLLAHNSRALGVDLRDIDSVVLSHPHWDHYGGLAHVARVRPGATVFLPSGCDPDFVSRLSRMGLSPAFLGPPTRLTDWMSTTGTLWGPPAEHGLVVRGPDGGLLITGCAHPGVDALTLRAASIAEGHLLGVIGGFHLLSADYRRLEGVSMELRALGVRFLAPIHCSGERARRHLRARLPDAYLDVRVGDSIELSAGRVVVTRAA